MWNTEVTMACYFDTFEVCIEKKKGILNLTPYLIRAVRNSGIANGIIVAQSLHTTAGIIVQENEPGIIAHDLPRLLDRLIPHKDYYRHNDLERRNPKVGPCEAKNGKAHLEYLLSSHTSVTFIIRAGAILLGEWVSALLIDFCPKRGKVRTVAITVLGE